MLKLPILGTSALNLFTSRTGLTNHLRREIFSQPESVTEELIDQHYRLSHQAGAQGALAAYLSGYLNHSVTDLLPRIEQPVWIAWGRDAVSPAVESADVWLHDLAGAELEVLPDSALWPHAETPETFTKALLEFLSGLRA
jgi:pimeloyl-ACP methyl ester carboxylesterase